MNSDQPRRCYCGGPEEAVYGHQYGTGQHCRPQVPTQPEPEPLNLRDQMAAGMADGWPIASRTDEIAAGVMAIVQEAIDAAHPTQWAYDQACAALNKHRERAEQAEQEVCWLSDLVPLPDREFRDSFWARVQEAEGNGCWEWQGGRQTNGYGSVYTPTEKRKQVAHRVAWQLTFGFIPDGIEVCHHVATTARVVDQTTCSSAPRATTCRTARPRAGTSCSVILSAQALVDPVVLDAGRSPAARGVATDQRGRDQVNMLRTLGAEAASKDGMTLDELAAFVEEAQKAGVRGGAQPKVTIKFGGRIRKVEVKG